MQCSKTKWIFEFPSFFFVRFWFFELWTILYFISVVYSGRRKIPQHARHVSPSHCDGEISTHFNSYFGEDSSSYPRQNNSTGILARIAQAILVKIPIEMCQFTKVPMTRLNESFVLQNFSQCKFRWYRQQFFIFQQIFGWLKVIALISNLHVIALRKRNFLQKDFLPITHTV